MNIANALKIDGWMEEKELVWLAIEASKHHRIVEVGSWMGRSTRALADNTAGIVLAVDTWNGSDEEFHQKLLKDKHPDWLYGLFLANMADSFGNILPIRLPSIKAAAACRLLSPFDMVFIDASHDYASVSADIAAWTPLVRSGGIICGHDRGYLPIHQAVHEAFPDRVEGDTDIWCVKL